MISDNTPTPAAQKKGGSSVEGGPAPMGIKLQLNSLTNSRRTMARIMRMYADGQVDNAQFRNLTYAFSTILQFFKAENEAELLRRIEMLEQQLEQVK